MKNDGKSADFSEEKAKKILDKFIKSWQDFGFTKFAVFTNDGEERMEICRSS